MNEADTARRIRACARAAALPVNPDVWPGVLPRLGRAGRQRTLRRATSGGVIAAGIAAVVTAVIVVPPGGTQPLSAATVARRAAAVLRGGAGLPPVTLTEVVTTARGYGSLTPLRVVEHIEFAAPDRWQDSATISWPGGRGIQRVTTIRDGGRIATISGRSISISPASGQGGSLFETSVVGQRLDWAAVLSSLGTGRCGRSLDLARHGPLIDGRPSLVLRIGAARCPSEAAPETDGPATFWLDPHTYLVLQAELHGPAGQLAQTVRVSALRYRPVLRAGTFALPTPAATPTAPQPGAVPTLAALRKALAYPPLLPARLPGGLRIGGIATIAGSAAGSKFTEFTITYANPSGTPVAQLYEAPGSSQSVHFSGRAVAIRPGITGTVSTEEGLILWWLQDDRYCSLQTGGTTTGLQLGTIPESELIQLAASFS
jgi:hypothetical protein